LSNRRVLFVSYLYPPAGGLALPGVQRTVKFLRYLPVGKKYVLTLKSELYPDFFSVDNSLSLPVSNEVITRVGSFDLFKTLLDIRAAVAKVFRRNEGKSAKATSGMGNESAPEALYLGDVKVGAAKRIFAEFKDLVSDILTFPDYAHGWIIPALWEGRKIIKSKNIDVIFATAMPWTSFLVGFGLKVLTGTKLIVDFRDPWATNPFAYNKSTILKKTERFCENMIVRKADCVTLNTPELTEEFQSRYSFLPGSKFRTLYNGYDPVDFKKAQRIDLSVDRGKLVLSHIGFLYGLRDPAPVLNALIEIRKKNPGLASNIVFQQIGHTNLDYDLNSYVKDMELDENFLDLGPLPYSEALGHMASSDILLIIQPKTTTQIPSKIYEYIFFNKPIVSIGSKNGALARLINNYDFGNIFSDSDICGLSEFFVQKADQKAKSGELVANYSNRKLFDIRNISNKLSEIIEEVCGGYQLN